VLGTAPATEDTSSPSLSRRPRFSQLDHVKIVAEFLDPLLGRSASPRTVLRFMPSAMPPQLRQLLTRPDSQYRQTDAARTRVRACRFGFFIAGAGPRASTVATNARCYGNTTSEILSRSMRGAELHARGETMQRRATVPERGPSKA
jgi:hypothetical protein